MVVVVVVVNHPQRRANALVFEGGGVVNKQPPSKLSTLMLGFEGDGVLVVENKGTRRGCLAETE